MNPNWTSIAKTPHLCIWMCVSLCIHTYKVNIHTVEVRPGIWLWVDLPQCWNIWSITVQAGLFDNLVIERRQPSGTFKILLNKCKHVRKKTIGLKDCLCPLAKLYTPPHCFWFYTWKNGTQSECLTQPIAVHTHSSQSESDIPSNRFKFERIFIWYPPNCLGLWCTLFAELN